MRSSIERSVSNRFDCSIKKNIVEWSVCFVYKKKVGFL